MLSGCGRWPQRVRYAVSSTACDRLFREAMYPSCAALDLSLIPLTRGVRNSVSWRGVRSLGQTRSFESVACPLARGVGLRLLPGPVSADWSPLTSAGVVTAVMLWWITLLSC